VLSHFRTGRALFGIHAASSAAVGGSSTMGRTSTVTSCSRSHFRAFVQVLQPA